MDSLSLKFVSEQAVAAAGVKVLKVAEEPDHVYYLASPQGTVQRVEAEPEPRDHHVLDIPSLVRFVEPFVGEQEVEIWYHRARVVAILDSDIRRDQVNLCLEFSPQLQALRHLEGKATPHGQKEFVRLLRVTLAGCVPSGLIDVVRHMKFRVNSSGEGVISHGKSSVGRTLEAQLTGEKEIPEEVNLEVPIWNGFQSHRKFRVPCAIEIDPAAEKISLTPLPGAIEEAVRLAEECLGNLLNEELVDTIVESSLPHVQVLYGTP